MRDCVRYVKRYFSGQRPSSGIAGGRGGWIAGIGSEGTRPAHLPAGPVPEGWNVGSVSIETVYVPAINWTRLLADSFWRKLEATGKNTWHCDVLIQFLPAQRKTIHFDFNLLQLLLIGRS